jgi:hypothetical protein
MMYNKHNLINYKKEIYLIINLLEDTYVKYHIL